MAQICPLCVTLPRPCVVVKNPPLISGLSTRLPHPPDPASLPASLPFCSSKAFSSYISTIVCVPSPHGSESPPPEHHHHHDCCVTEEQKRECQTPPTRSLSHWSPHLSSRWGCVFSGVSFNPKSPPKWKTSLPHRSLLLSCPSSTCSAATRPWPGHVPFLSHPNGESY